MLRFISNKAYVWNALCAIARNFQLIDFEIAGMEKFGVQAFLALIYINNPMLGSAEIDYLIIWLTGILKKYFD